MDSRKRKLDEKPAPSYTISKKEKKQNPGRRTNHGDSDNAGAAEATTTTGDQNSVVGISPLEALPKEVLRKIFSYISIRELSKMEMVSRRIRSSAMVSWSDLKAINLAKFAKPNSWSALIPPFSRPPPPTTSTTERGKVLRSIFAALSKRCPNLESIRSFHAVIQWLASANYFPGKLVTFASLRSVDFSNCRLEARRLADFLSTAVNRANLEELILVNCMRVGENSWNADQAMDAREENDEIISRAFENPEGRQPLRLKKFVYGANNRCHGNFLGGLDASRLHILSFFGNHTNNWELENLLVRRAAVLEELHINVEITGTYISSLYGEDRYDSSDVVDHNDRVCSWLPSLSLRSRHLKKFHLSGTISDAQCSSGELKKELMKLSRSCPAIVDIGLHDCIYSGDKNAVFEVIAENFSNLEIVNLNIINANTSEAIKKIITGFDGRLRQVGLLCDRGDRFSQLYSAFSKPAPEIDADLVRAVIFHQADTLTRLHLHVTNSVSSDVFEHLSELSNIKDLSVGGTSVNDQVVISWCDEKSLFGQRLESLQLESTSIGDEAVKVISTRLFNLRRLDLISPPSSTRITDAGLAAIADTSSLPMLRKLNLAGCRGISASGVQSVVDGCKKLVRLNLRRTEVHRWDITRVADRLVILYGYDFDEDWNSSGMSIQNRFHSRDGDDSP